MVGRDYEVIEAFLNKVRLRILNRPRMIDLSVITNEDLQELVHLPTAANLIVRRQLKFVLKLMTKTSSETARRMLFAEIKDPTRLIGGRGKSVFPRCLAANLVYLSTVVKQGDGLLELC